ncbi:NAD(P)H-hydrate dehydratase [Roseiconus lacunae]|uniref:ADP-dependent (S)-NAD(P)H-hydrate dehydratase n=1 Tax=Roseiconus lacunae TaxID=2605694 RepID=A0ABT7PIT4_9BACT|nr:NAD(P)H-hydrate dehydratase [Roseiconus lacunae]MCD0458521.1 NAD(P)H-hydrate dehydratase [Roseiconus lacunae]MDM4016408.1 NAD(P)H-hydrate dehydratase [Roseiconus lacunae]
MKVPSPPPFIESAPADQRWPYRAADAHKGNFGRVLLVGGSRGMAGSISLSSMAALATGSGLVSVAIPDRCLETVAGFHPGVMTIPIQDDGVGAFGADASVNTKPYDVVGCGPGMGTGAGATALVEQLFWQADQHRVFDADAINIIAKENWLHSPALLRNSEHRGKSTLPLDQSTLVLTPHPGELARLTGVSAKDRDAQIEAAKSLAERFGMTIVVKGGPTWVVSGELLKTAATADVPAQNSQGVQVYRNRTGNPGMATAGSGDVLTGVVTSLLGQGLGAFDAATLAVYLHGLAGDFAAQAIGQASLTCREILGHLPAAIRAIE